MTTRRGNKDKTPLTEDELEIVRANLIQQEARLKEEVAAFNKIREETERERMENKRTEYDLEAGLNALRDDFRRELDNLRRFLAGIATRLRSRHSSAVARRNDEYPAIEAFVETSRTITDSGKGERKKRSLWQKLDETSGER